MKLVDYARLIAYTLAILIIASAVSLASIHIGFWPGAIAAVISFLAVRIVDNKIMGMD